MNKKEDISFDWLQRYTGTNPNDYGEWILLTNFHNYVEKFSDRFGSKINGIGGPMTSSINSDGLSPISWKMRRFKENHRYRALYPANCSHTR